MVWMCFEIVYFVRRIGHHIWSKLWVRGRTEAGREREEGGEGRQRERGRKGERRLEGGR